MTGIRQKGAHVIICTALLKGLGTAIMVKTNSSPMCNSQMNSLQKEKMIQGQFSIAAHDYCRLKRRGEAPGKHSRKATVGATL